MTGEGTAPLPIVPPPFRDERLSSWLERVADVYRVSLGELQAHVGWIQPAPQLELEPARADIERIASATHYSVERVLTMTFHGTPTRYRSLLRPISMEICPSCSRGLSRPQRLKGWSFAFAFLCDRHHELLFGRAMHGVGALGNNPLGRRGAEILLQWAMETGTTAVPVDSVLSLLLLPSRKASPPMPWELGSLPRARQRDPSILSRPCRRPVLSVVVPDFATAVPISDQHLPSIIADLPGASWAERFGLAIGVATVLRNPVDAVVRILRASDDFGREQVMALIEQWPWAIRDAVGRGVVHSQRKRKAKSDAGQVQGSIALNLHRSAMGLKRKDGFRQLGAEREVRVEACGR